MGETRDNRLLKRQVGIVSECAILGFVALLTLTSFLSIIGNPLPDSLLLGTILGVTVVGLRYLLGVVVGYFQFLISNRRV